MRLAVGRTTAARPIRGCRSGWSRATRGRGSPARCAGPRRLRAGAWPRYDAGRAGRRRARTPPPRSWRARPGGRSGVHAPAPRAQVQRRARTLADQHGPPGIAPALHGPDRGQADRDDPFLAALAEDPDGPAPVVEVAQVEPAQFADPDAGAYRSSMIAVSRQARVAAASRAVGPAGPAAGRRGGEHRLHLLWRRTSGSVAGGLGRAQQRPGIAVQPAAGVTERGERPGRRRPPGHRRPGHPAGVLVGEPGPDDRDVQVRAGRPARPGRRAQAGRRRPPGTRADGVRRQPALGRQVPLELRQPLGQPGQLPAGPGGCQRSLSLGLVLPVPAARPQPGAWRVSPAPVLSQPPAPGAPLDEAGGGEQRRGSASPCPGPPRP